MSILIIGAGNDLWGDDSLGFHILNSLRKFSLPSDIDTLYIGVNSFLIHREFAKYDRIIIIDGVLSKGQAGDMYYAPVQKLPRQSRPYSVHDITWLEMIHMLRLTDKTYLFGIECTPSIKPAELSLIIQANIGYYTAILYKIITFG